MNSTVDLSRRAFFGRVSDRLNPSGPTAAKWYQVPEVTGGDGDVFWSGWCGNGEVFIAGDNGRIIHFEAGAGSPDTDATWQTMDVPVTVPIHGLWGLNHTDLHAVGWMGCILHYDGQQWTKVRGAVVDHDEQRFSACAENTPLFAISGRASGEAWAVGDEGTILYFDGAGWSEEPSGVQHNLRAVTCGADQSVYVAGLDGVVLHRTPEGQWRSLESPYHCGFQAALWLGEDELLLAGGRYFVDKSGFRGELVHYKAGQFQAIHSDRDMPRLRALRAYKGGVLIVADRGQLFYLKDNSLTPLACDSSHDLMDIVPMPSGEAVIVGDFGTVMTAAPGFIKALAEEKSSTGNAHENWVAMPSPTRHQLWSVWQSDDGTCYAGGEAGTVLRQIKDEWEQLPFPDEVAIHCFWGNSEAGVFAAGQMGRIYRYDGEHWQLHFDLHLDLTILAMWGSGPDCIFAVGDEGLILHFDGLRWQRVASGTQSALYDIWAYDAQHMLVVGDFGLILRYNGKDWKSFNADTEQFLYGVWGRSLDDVWVVGLSGTATHFDGMRWQAVPTRLRDDLMSMDGSEAGVFAVGTRGCIVVLRDGQWRQESTPVSAGLRSVCAGKSGEVYAVGDRGTILKRLP